MEEIETIPDYVTDEVESLIVVNESVETEGLLSNPSNSKPANVNEIARAEVVTVSLKAHGRS